VASLITSAGYSHVNNGDLKRLLGNIIWLFFGRTLAFSSIAVVDVEYPAEVIRLARPLRLGNGVMRRKVHLTKTKRLAVRPSKEISATLDGRKRKSGHARRVRFCFRRSHGSSRPLNSARDQTRRLFLFAISQQP